jgi:hypothetical protein
MALKIEKIYQTENGWRKNCGSPHEVRAQKRHTYFVRVSAIFAIQFLSGIVVCETGTAQTNISLLTVVVIRETTSRIAIETLVSLIFISHHLLHLKS